MSTAAMLAPARPKLSKRASSSASFQGQLRTLQSPGLPSPALTEEDEIVPDPRTGQPVRIASSGIVHTLTPPVSAPAQRLVATLFAPAGAMLSDLHIYEFTQLMDRLVVPYTPGTSSTRTLAATAAGPAVAEVTLTMPSLLPLPDLRRHEALAEFTAVSGVAVALRENSVWRRHPRLVLLDAASAAAPGARELARALERLGARTAAVGQDPALVAAADPRQVVGVAAAAEALDAMAAAGLLAVAWNADEAVRERAPVAVRGESLLELLYLFGFTKEEVEELVTE